MGQFLTGATQTGNSFAAQSAPINNQDFTTGLQGSAMQYNQNFANQNQLASQLLAQANGQGPSVADQQFQQNSNQAINQNAGFLASQQGISPALAQRQAAQNQANMSQQAAGQAGIMKAQEQLGAENSLSGLYGQQGQESLGMNSNLQNAQAAQNNANVSNTAQMNQANGAVAAGNQKQSANLAGGLMSGASGALAALYKGGTVPSAQDEVKQAMMRHVQNFDYGGSVQMTSGMPANYGVDLTPQNNQGANQAGGQASKYLQMLFSSPQQQIIAGGGGGDPSDAMSVDPMMAGDAVEFASRGGKIHPMLAHMGSIYHPETYAMGGRIGGDETQVLKAEGGAVPGKAQVSHDAPQNDKVPTMLSPGEEVIDLDTLKEKGKIGDAARMVAKAINEKTQKEGSHDAPGDFKAALKKAISGRKKSA